MLPTLKLRFRRDYDAVLNALETVAERFPDDWPCVLVLGHKIVIPGVPEVVEAVKQEFLARGLIDLAARVGDGMRWRSY
jgi:hypothetical protein